MLKRLFGIGLAAAILMVAGPAMAAVSFADPALDDLIAAPLPSDCLASFDAATAILFVEVESGCDVTLAEATGLCLAPIAIAPAGLITGVLDVELGISCTAIRPSPPG